MPIVGVSKGILTNQLPIYALDGIAQPSVTAYALHRVNRNYYGHLVTVRRSSDGATQNFGFGQYEINPQEILDFVGAGTGTVTQWFDQSGNNRHIAEPESSNQPIIANSGFITNLNSNGKPGLNFRPDKRLFGTYSFDLNTAIVAARSESPTFTNYHGFLNTNSLDSSGILRRFSLAELNNTGFHSNPFPESARRNGEPRTVALSGTLAPITETFVATITNPRPARTFLSIGSFAGTIGGACLQSCMIAFANPLSLQDTITIEQRLMSFYGIT